METKTEGKRRPAPARRRDVRLTDRGERIVKRHTGPGRIPFGALVLDAKGVRWTRKADGFVLAEGTDGTPHSALDLPYPVRELKPEQRGRRLDRAERRQVERNADQARAELIRRRLKRAEVAQLAAFLHSKGVGVDPEPVTDAGSPTGYVVGPDGIEP